VVDAVMRLVAHGGLLHDELASLGLVDDDVLDVSVNVNPYGPSAAMRAAIAAAAIHRYPDPTASPARLALARSLDVDPARVVVGNGAVDLLWSLARAYLGAGDGFMVVEPAFSEMRTAARRAGARIVEHRTTPETDFDLDLDKLDAHLAEVRPRVLYLCTPSNPVGRCTPIDAIAALAERHADTLVVADLSFLSLSARHAELASARSDRVVWVRSLTKDHALAGVRVGFALASSVVAARLEAERPPWSVNAPAQAAVVAACTDEAQRFVGESREHLLADRARLVDALRALDLRVHPSETIYALVSLGSRMSATALRARMLARHRVLVRDATSFGLPHHVRLGARPTADLARLVSALRQEISS
jgi:histidinol-phosphate/aromatic aminotransferase/cobyric acid decarboxylase-like protein